MNKYNIYSAPLYNIEELKEPLKIKNWEPDEQLKQSELWTHNKNFDYEKWEEWDEIFRCAELINNKEIKQPADYDLWVEIMRQAER